MSGWTKLFSSIVTSSVWCENDATLRVWIAMLATADADGIVEGAVPGFANLARVTVEQMRAAVAKLSSPDPDSRTPDHEGRRVECIEGGWRILNYDLYRQRGQAKEGSRAPAMRRYRARKRQADAGNALPADVTRYPEERGKRIEERERTTTPPTPRGGASRRPRRGDDALLTRVDTPEAREVVRLRAEILGGDAEPTLPKLKAAHRALAAGFAVDACAQAFHAIQAAREREPDASLACFCATKNRSFEYALRPDVLQKIVDEAQAPGQALALARPNRHATVGEKTMAAAERFISRHGGRQ